jgi:hypothetical protein
VKRSAQFIDLIYDLEDVYDDGPDGRDAVDQYEHSVQTGTRALRAGLPDRLVALAVLHDAFRVIAPYNHGEALAVAIGDRLTPEEKAILANHSAWQHDIRCRSSRSIRRSRRCLMSDKPLKPARSQAELVALRQRWIQIAISSIALVCTVLTMLRVYGIL